MITVHHLENSRSQRILWLLEELGVTYEVKRYERDPKTMLAPDALRQIHPLGKSPLITDGEQVLAETGAIVQCLIEQYGDGKLAPARDDQQAFLRYRYWLHYAEGSMMPWLVMKLVFDRLSKSPVPLPIRPMGALIGGGVKKQFIHPQLKLHLDYLDNELKDTQWFVGNDLTGADIMMSFPLEAAEARGFVSAERRPHLQAFLDAIHARPAYQQALERGGKYELLL